MLKKYKTTARSMSIIVMVDGKTKRIDFKRDNIKDGFIGCSYSTDDEKKQKAIEGHQYFGRKLFPYIWTDDVEVKQQDQPVIKEIERAEKIEKRKYNKRK